MHLAIHLSIILLSICNLFRCFSDANNDQGALGVDNEPALSLPYGSSLNDAVTNLSSSIESSLSGSGPTTEKSEPEPRADHLIRMELRRVGYDEKPRNVLVEMYPWDASNIGIDFICDKLQFAEGDLPRCRHFVSHGLRLLSFKASYHAFLSSLKTFLPTDDFNEKKVQYIYPDEAAIDMRLHYANYAYRQRSRYTGRPPSPDRSVCLVGRFSWTLADAIMNADSSYVLYVFSNFDAPYERDFFLGFSRTLPPGRIAVPISTNVLYYNEHYRRRTGMNFCDILHIRDTYSYSPSDVEVFAREILQIDENMYYNEPDFIPLVWERLHYEKGANISFRSRVMSYMHNYGRDYEKDPAYDENLGRSAPPYGVDWIATGTYHTYGILSLFSDKNGAYSLGYNWNEQSLTSFLYGRILPISMSRSLSALSHCPRAELTKDDVYIVISYINRVFDDTAFGLQDALQRIGFARVYLMGDFNVTLVGSLRSEQQQRPTLCQPAELLQISIGSHENQILAPSYISFHMEQPWTDFDGADFAIALHGAEAVWTFTEVHKQGLVRSMNISASDVDVVPLYTKGLALRASARLSEIKQDIDVLFLGGCRPRRNQILTVVNNWCLEVGIMCELSCVGMKTVHHDEERDLLVSRAKVVINIHNENTSSLELHRVLYLWSLGKAIVSERSSVDVELDAYYEKRGALLMANTIQELQIYVMKLLLDDTLREAIGRNALATYAAVQANLKPLESAMTRWMLKKGFNGHA